MKRLLDLFLRLRRRLLHLRDHAAAAEPGRTRSDAAHAAGHAVPAPAGPQRPAGGGADPLDALLDDLAAGADTELRALMCPLASDLDRWSRPCARSRTIPAGGRPS